MASSNDERISATDVVRTQLYRIEKAAQPVTRTEVASVRGYSHSANLMDWCYRQGLIHADKITPQGDVAGDATVDLAVRGESWLNKFGRRGDPDVS